MTENKPFRTKIPARCHPKIMEWYTCGMSVTGILSKLETDFQFKTNNRTLTRLLQHLKDEQTKITQTVIVNQVQHQVLNDFNKLNKLCDDLVELAEISKNSDNNLYLKTVDRLTRILQLKFGISTKDDKNKTDINKDDLLDSIFAKLKQ